MKRTIIIIAITAIFGACNTNSKTSVKDDTILDSASQTTNKQMAYACPMDCENGKIYDKPGKCPVCEMELEKK